MLIQSIFQCHGWSFAFACGCCIMSRSANIVTNDASSMSTSIILMQYHVSSNRIRPIMLGYEKYTFESVSAPLFSCPSQSIV